MIEASNSTKQLTFQSFSTTPFAEGWARIERSMLGVDLAQLSEPSLPLSERVIDLLTGVVLCLPIINAIIWIFIHYIGNAESFSISRSELPFVPWEAAEAAAKKEPTVIAPSLAVPSNRAPKRVEEYSTTDQENSELPYEVNVRIEHYTNSIVVKNIAPPKKYTECIYDPNWLLQSMKHTDHTKNLKFTIAKEGDTLVLKGTKDGAELDLEVTLPDPTIPWIQQPSQGIRPFVKSGKSYATFYGINPQDFTLTVGKLNVRKMPDKHPKYNSVVEIGLSSNSWPKSLYDARISSHDPITGKQYEETWDVPFFYSSTSTIN